MRNLSIFLNKVEYAQTWIEGGSVPLNLASAYYADEAGGVMTPDENLVLRNDGLPEFGAPHFRFLRPDVIEPPNDGPAPGFYATPGSIINIDGVARTMTRHVSLTGKYEDGLVLCFTTYATRSQMQSFAKTAGVEIVDFPSLKRSLDEQIGVDSVSGQVRYTRGPDRNHFLKSRRDSWQKEHRLFWPVVPEAAPVWVRPPPGVAVALNVSAIPKE